VKLWPWRRATKRLAPIDHGDGFYRLPEQAADRDDDTGLLIAEWAAGQWARWDAGHRGWFINHGTDGVCPACYTTCIAEDARFMSSAHSRPDAQQRWRRIAAKHDRKRAVLGPCRCGRKLTPGQAAADSQSKLNQYHC
jgi:hypothetical protein